EAATGQDPRERMQKVIVAYDSTVAINPKDSGGLTGRVQARTFLARWALETGHPAQDYIEEGQRAVRQVLEVHADNPRVLASVARFALLEGRSDLLRRRSPAAALARSRQAVEEVLKTNPQNADAQVL